MKNYIRILTMMFLSTACTGIQTIPDVPKALADYQKDWPMYSPLKLTWDTKQTQTNDASGNTYELPTVQGWNSTSEMKASNRRLQITFLATTSDKLESKKSKSSNE